MAEYSIEQYMQICHDLPCDGPMDPWTRGLMVLGRWYFLSSRAADAGTGGLAALGIGGFDVQQSLGGPRSREVNTKAPSQWLEPTFSTIP